MENLLKAHFPELSEKSLKEKILEVSQVVTFPANTTILEQGSYIKLLPLVLKGAIKVVRTDENGHELLVYYIKTGESCAVSHSAYLNHNKSNIKAVTLEETLALLIPTQYIDSWMRSYPSWQEFVVKLYDKRFEELLTAVDMIAFRKLDDRLLTYLSAQSKLANSLEIKVTHQQIADDLSSSREVISRMLKQLEKRGMIEVSRNSIKILSLV